MKNHFLTASINSFEHYGKSIARDKAEQDIGNVIKTLQPTSALIAIVKAMFRDAWDQQSKTVDGLKASLKKHIQSVERQIESVMDRLLATTNETIIQRYEPKISAFERDKTGYADQIMHLDNPNRGTYEDKLEPALQIIASPWKLWASGNITLRKLVLKLAFAERIRYDRNKGPRTANLSMPFKA